MSFIFIFFYPAFKSGKLSKYGAEDSLRLWLRQGQHPKGSSMNSKQNNTVQLTQRAKSLKYCGCEMNSKQVQIINNQRIVQREVQSCTCLWGCMADFLFNSSKVNLTNKADHENKKKIWNKSEVNNRIN